MDLPSFDTRPSNPLYGPLSMWLCGDNPLDPSDRPESVVELAEALGVEPQRLHQVRASKGFRQFHTQHTSNLDEIVRRRREMLDSLYELGSSGNVTAASAFLQHTKNAESLAETSRTDPASMSPADAANLTDEELDALSGQGSPPNT